ncbi:hypothetical protein [Streptomyces sp. NBC_00503]|uniref:hypothetical protein n=1 Tax=Streptomyces sp. NBC_00503 TaxID=2903659 RepID=UPI002E80AE90|nr:hypothetical protein [Streptomyces sp. NBC_00503]WUD83334.1 hypothetical protein OG490_23805 [Streptomyces sp. NBC_00503]
MRNFASALAACMEGRGVRTHTELDMTTENALWAIARARPEPPDELVAAAYRAFAGQLDGTNAVAEREAFVQKLIQRGMSEEIAREFGRGSKRGG